MVKPVTVIGLADPVAVMPPGLDVTRYDVALAPGVKDTTALAFPPVAVTLVGAVGAGISVTSTLGDEYADEPEEFTPLTVKV